MKSRAKSTALFVLVTILALICFALFCYSLKVEGTPNRTSQDGHTDLAEISEGITRVTPSVSAARADELSLWFADAAEESEIDPFLLVAIARRESNFMVEVERGELRGSKGEIGLMQNHGVSLGFRPTWCSHRLEGAHCQIHTGARFLAWVRNHCGGSKSRWVASYGMRECATERAAPLTRSVKRARRFYFQAGGTDWE